MHRSRLGHLCLFATLTICMTSAAPAAAQDELLDQLNVIPGLTIIQERPTPTGGRFFVMRYEQPVNHLQPWRGTFGQRVTLYHQGFDRPTVFYSGGYTVSTAVSRTEVTRIVEGNQLNIEHRFFLPSRPAPADWRDLTIFQQASDDHRVVIAFRALYHGRWLRAGASKGGMQATYHTRFYPQDVDGLIAYVAPNDVIDNRDAYIRFLDRVGTNPACRAGLKEVQRQALLRRPELVAMMLEQTEPLGFTYDRVFGSPERAFELLVIEMPFTFWQLFGDFYCDAIPAADASTQAIFDFLDLIQGFVFWTDNVYEPRFVPYFYQAGTQLGYPTLDDSHLRDLQLFPGIDVPRSFVPRDIEMPPFQRWVMLDVDLFVRFFGRREMFIYGEYDPWGAEPFHPEPFATDAYTYIVPRGTHGANVAQLPAADRDAATATIRRWAGLPPLSPGALTTLHDPARQQAEPDLDQLDRFERRIPRPH